MYWLVHHRLWSPGVVGLLHGSEVRWHVRGEGWGATVRSWSWAWWPHIWHWIEHHHRKRLRNEIQNCNVTQVLKFLSVVVRGEKFAIE